MKFLIIIHSTRLVVIKLIFCSKYLSIEPKNAFRETFETCVELQNQFGINNVSMKVVFEVLYGFTYIFWVDATTQDIKNNLL